MALKQEIQTEQIASNEQLIRNQSRQLIKIKEVCIHHDEALEVVCILGYKYDGKSAEFAQVKGLVYGRIENNRTELVSVYLEQYN